MFRPTIHRTLRAHLVAAVAFLALAALVVFLVLIERRNARLGVRTPSIFMPGEPPQ